MLEMIYIFGNKVIKDFDFYSKLFFLTLLTMIVGSIIGAIIYQGQFAWSNFMFFLVPNSIAQMSVPILKKPAVPTILVANIAMFIGMGIAWIPFIY